MDPNLLSNIYVFNIYVYVYKLKYLMMALFAAAGRYWTEDPESPYMDIIYFFKNRHVH